MNIKIFIIHVSTQEDRRIHMEAMLCKANLPFEHEYINEGDVKDLNEDVLDKYFASGDECNMHYIGPGVSCAYKHLMATERIITQNLDGALIFEDDIFLHKGFTEIFLKSLKEFEQKYSDAPALVSYEDSSLLLVPGSKRRKGQILYVGNHDRYCGALFISRKCAEVITTDVLRWKTHLPIDGYHNHLLHQGKILYLWSHPALATQGSFNGKIKTLISSKSNNMIGFKWFFKYNYKKFICWLR